MHFNNMLHVTDAHAYGNLIGETATIRTAITGFLITAPKRAHVVKFLRDYDDFKGEAFFDAGGNEYGEWNRKIRFYRWNWYPDEVKFRIQIPFQDKYSCYIPDNIYFMYLDRKLYFEIKHAMQNANTIAKVDRIIFIENQDNLPTLKGYPDLKEVYIKKWLKEEEMIEDELKKDAERQKIRETEMKIREQKIYEKFKKLQEATINKENVL